MKGNSTNVSPATVASYDYKKGIKTEIIPDLKVSKDSVPTWGSADMNEANIKAVSYEE